MPKTELASASPVAQLRRKIETRSARVGIIGLGYVGLPLGLLFSEEKFRVAGFDIDATKVEKLNSGASYIHHIPSTEIQAAGKRGFRATADPLLFKDATVTGTYILDPWYPRVSSIWGPSDPPGTFQDASEMVRNYLPWKRPEGSYPQRDGKFLLVVPTIAVTPVG